MERPGGKSGETERGGDLGRQSGQSYKRGATSNHICPGVPSAQLQVVVSVVDSREWRGRSPGLGGGRPWD